MSIEDIVTHEDLNRVYFVKVDTERREADALKGSWETIRTFVRRLTVHVYDKQYDLPDVWALTRKTHLYYEFRLPLSSPELQKTTIFARVAPASGGVLATETKADLVVLASTQTVGAPWLE